MFNAEPQDAVLRLQRARKVLAGQDENGLSAHPKQSDADVISFASGNGNRRPHPSVVAAGVAALLDTQIVSLERYFFGRKYEEFDRMVTELFMKEGLDEEISHQIVSASGTIKLFNAFLYSVSIPRDQFLVGSGYYHSLAGWADVNDVQLNIIQTSAENDYKLVRSDLEAWYDLQVEGSTLPRGILLFNPTYTGAVYTYDEMADLADFISSNDLVALEDSIFMHTIFDDSVEKVHLAQFEQARDRVVTVNGGSKAFNIANMRIGWGCGPKPIIEKMSQYIGATQGTVPHISKAMAVAAVVNAPESYSLGNKLECKKRTDLILELTDVVNRQVSEQTGIDLKIPVMEVAHVPQAGHSILLNFPALQGLITPSGVTIRDSIDLTRYFLQEAKVCLSPGYSIGYNDMKLRISHACVGLKYTYQDVQHAEIASVLQELSQRLDFNTSLTEVAASLGGNEAGAADWSHLDFGNSGFEKGRELIREGILDRMLPAIVKLLLHNHSLLEVSTV